MEPPCMIELYMLVPGQVTSTDTTATGRKPWSEPVSQNVNDKSWGSCEVNCWNPRADWWKRFRTKIGTNWAVPVILQLYTLSTRAEDESVEPQRHLTDCPPANLPHLWKGSIIGLYIIHYIHYSRQYLPVTCFFKSKPKPSFRWDIIYIYHCFHVKSNVLCSVFWCVWWRLIPSWLDLM